jgi:hypothetical protein
MARGTDAVVTTVLVRGIDISVKQARRRRALANRNVCDRIRHQRKEVERKMLGVAVYLSRGLKSFILWKRGGEIGGSNVCDTL